MAELRVTLSAGDGASGLATMLADLLRDNVKDFPSRARAAALARGEVVMRAADRDASVTLSFRRGEVVVTDGSAPGAPVVAGPWLEMAKLCSGQLSPVKAVASGALKITPGRHLTALAASGYALSVPAAFYGDEEAARKQRERRRNAGVAVGVGLAVLLVVVVVRRRSRPGRAAWRCHRCRGRR